MAQALQRKLVTFEEFITKYPENSNKRYELHDGVVIEMPPPTGDHEEIILFLIERFILEYTRLKLSYGCPKTAFVKHQLDLFRGSQPIQSPTFPELDLTAEQIFNAGNI
ncbi:MAG: Uma2 family endonuclease [Nostoc sp.]